MQGGPGEKVAFSAGYAEMVSEKGFLDDARGALRQHGLKVTEQRLQVLAALHESPSALSAYEIHAKIKAAGGRIDVVSVYRILAACQSIGLIHYIGAVDGYRVCGLTHGPEDIHGHHSQHMVCLQCRKVVEVEMPDPVVAASLTAAANQGFTEGVVQLEVMGVCGQCRPAVAQG